MKYTYYIQFNNEFWEYNHNGSSKKWKILEFHII